MRARVCRFAGINNAVGRELINSSQGFTLACVPAKIINVCVCVCEAF